MGEIDYQMALLLQHRFEQEYKASKEAQKSDQELARQLQEQFQQELGIDSPLDTPTKDSLVDPSLELARQLQEQFEQEHATDNPQGLVYNPPKTKDSSKSLVDPSWELVDPTPDIHALFMVFNERFFWNKLLAVCVSWSKRMTTCAGICSYNGRGGMCSITLSEPLLKLRPRKDLVETLLHEMIHAYLFVTHNNKDRDGHGPEFHKHMFRINKESGTNITVYHDFHDEVRLYQQHWWRCNGPCQHRKPYFGMVRRASNRAPGPNDRWWAEHSRTCGGTFIKVKEPEKGTKKEQKVQNKVVTNVKTKDIRDFMTPGTSNVKGFKDLSSGNVRGKFNSSSTVVVTKNSKGSGESSYKPTVINTPASTNNNTSTSTSSVRTDSTGSYTDEFLSVRNHWANKFNSSSKRPLDQPSTSTKIPKVSPLDQPSTSKSEDYCPCPVCNKKVLMTDLNHHLDVCLVEPKPEETPEEEKECPLCNSKVNSAIFDLHVEKCLMKVYEGVEEKLDPQETVSCLACNKKILKSQLNSHLDECMLEIFDADVGTNHEEKDDSSKFNCPFCLKMVEEKEMKEHLDACLDMNSTEIVSLLDDTF